MLIFNPFLDTPYIKASPPIELYPFYGIQGYVRYPKMLLV